MTIERYRTALDEAVEVTRASEESIARVQQRLDTSRRVEGYDSLALGDVPDPAKGAVERVQRRLGDAPDSRSRWIVPRIAVAATAMAGVVLAVGLTVRWLPSTPAPGELPPTGDDVTAPPMPTPLARSEDSVPSPDQPPSSPDSVAQLAPSPATPLPPSPRTPGNPAVDVPQDDASPDVSLANRDPEPETAPPTTPRVLDSVRQTELTAHEGVVLSYLGAGRLDGTPASPVIRWESGELNVEVEPGRGTELVVFTAEAEIAVIGTGFRVVRSGSATDVLVRHGLVSVTCAHGEARALGANEFIRCLPAGPAVALQRARELQSLGRLEEALEITAAVDPGGDAIAAEILYVQLELLTALQRHDEAIRVGEQYLALTEAPRRAEAEQILLSIRQK